MMSRFRTFLLLALVGLVLYPGPEAQAGSKAPEIGTQGQSAAAQAHAMMALHKRLSAFPRAAVQHSVVLTADEADILTRPDVDSTGRLRVGVHRAVGKTVSNMGADLVVRIPGAPAVRLELTKVKGTVAVFNDAGEAHEYTEDGFTHTFSGEEVRVRGSVQVSGAGAVNLGGNLCRFNAECTENATCVSMPQSIDTARNAYASILFRSGPYYYVCSGGLLADSDNGTQIPYFLTANHCVERADEASTVETFFQFIKYSSDVNDPEQECPLPRPGDTVGSTIMATDSSGDFTLLVLSEDPPSGSVFLGWNYSPVAGSNGYHLYRISHPGGAPQAYSEHIVDTGAPTCQSWPRGERIYSRDIVGATEGGSSGSPVLNDEAQVVGQLSGACGYNVNDECDSVLNATVDGAFAFYYQKIQPFLGDGSIGCSTAADCDDGLACNGTETCVSGACQPGILIDCDDSVTCTVDKCNEPDGSCTNVADNGLCDNGLFCDGVEYCDTETDCYSTGNPCAAGESCNEGTESCDQPGFCGDGTKDAGEDCDDGAANGTTTSCCNADCAYASAGTSCPDGEYCNGEETCDGAGACQAGTDPCQAGETCNDVTDTCDVLTCADLLDKGTCNADPDCEWIGHPRNGECQEAVPCVLDETTEQSCSDGADNDCDGMTDCADMDCSNNSACICGDYSDRKTCQARGCTWSNRDKMCRM